MMQRAIQTALGISVVICAYSEERWHDLLAAVESILQQTLPPGEIILVIDHNPGLLKRVREHIPGVVVVENTDARGLSGARNSGIAVAKGQIIAFLDDDAVATPDWLAAISEEFTNPRVLGIGGPVMPLWLDKSPAWLPKEFYWIVGCTYRGMPESTQAIRNPIGANMAFRREVFETVGGFRSGIGRVGTWPVGCEETELCIRARQHWPGRVFLYEPRARIHHRIPSHRANWRYFRSRCYAEGLSKAAVARYVGAKDGLASERTYILQILPRGIVRGLTDALHKDDLTGLARAGVIMFGLAVTIAGYVVGSTFLQVEKSRTKRKNVIAREKLLSITYRRLSGPNMR
jgi:glucosyl-dolichyl phosphate glucuronosyltransferase